MMVASERFSLDMMYARTRAQRKATNFGTRDRELTVVKFAVVMVDYRMVIEVEEADDDGLF